MIEKLRRIVESLGYPFFFGSRDEVYAYLNSVPTVVACYRQGGGGSQQFFVFKFKGEKPQLMYEDVMREIKRQFNVGVQRVFFNDDVLEARFPLMAKTYTEGGARPTPTGPDYLKFTAQGPATISMTHENYEMVEHPDIEISMDGQTWETWNFSLIDDYWVADEISLGDGETVMMRGNNPNGTGGFYIEEEDDYEYYYFVIDGDVAASGDVNCLVDKIGGKSTTLAEQCYNYMFYGCTGLTAAPTLPATTLAEQCYYNMFYGCTGLTAAPTLPATTLAANCYNSMFYGCTGLTEIEVHATAWNTSWTNNWVYGVSASGVFRKPSGTSISEGVSGIPSGWTVENI